MSRKVSAETTLRKPSRMSQLAPDDIAVIVNPNARWVHLSRTPQAICFHLAEHGLRPRLYLTTGPGDASDGARRAAEQGFGRIVAAGGDGTVGEVAGALSGTESAMGIIPIGTANALASQTGLPVRSIAAACRTVATGRVVRIDVGTCNGRRFCLTCGVGLDAAVARRARGATKQVLGRWAFVGHFVRCALTEPMRNFRVVVDGQTYAQKMWGVVVCNGPLYTWRLALSPSARLDDGLLHVTMFHQPSRPALFRAVARKWISGGPTAISGTTSAVGRAIEVDSSPPAPWQADGDPLGATPVKMGVRPGSLRLIVPQERPPASISGRSSSSHG